LENAKKNLVLHFEVGRHASFPQKPVVNKKQYGILIVDETQHGPHSTCYSDIDFGKAQNAVWQHHVTYWGHCYLLSGQIQQKFV
jgi:hypothetical protein